MIHPLPAHKFIRAAMVALSWATVGAAQPAASTTVAPGDRFRIRTLGADAVAPDSTGRVVIDDRFVAALLPGGSVSVRGLTPHAAVDSVTRRLSDYLRPDAFSVAFERRVTVLGAVRRADVLFVDLSVRLRDAVALAGGLGDSAEDNYLLLIRAGVSERILDWATTPAGDRELQSGDLIVVPRERWFKRNAVAIVSGASVLVSIIISISR